MRLCAPVLLGLVLACGSTPPEEAASGTDAAVQSERGSDQAAEAVPLCAVSGSVLTEHEEPIPGLEVELRASERSGERSWRGLASQTVPSGADGSFRGEVPCGTRVELVFPGWLWPVRPEQITASSELPPIRALLVPEREVLLRVTDAAGQVLSAQLVRSGGETLPIPPSGLLLQGLPYGGVAGRVEAEGQPSRTWRLNRSDQLNEVSPKRFEATLRLGEEGPLWVHLPDPREVDGVWCVSEGRRGETCKLRDSAWLCECGADRKVGIALEDWDVGLVRTVQGSDLEIEDLPQRVRQCLRVDGGGELTVQPLGVEDTLLLGRRGPADGLCLDMGLEEVLFVRLVGEESRTWEHRVGGDEEVLLPAR